MDDSASTTCRVRVIESTTPADDALDVSKNYNDDLFYNLRIDDAIWHQRIQDVGCTKEALPHTTYLRSKIPPIGPEGHGIYYYNLTAVAIDIIKKMVIEKEMGRGWNKAPKILHR